MNFSRAYHFFIGVFLIIAPGFLFAQSNCRIFFGDGLSDLPFVNLPVQLLSEKDTQLVYSDSSGIISLHRNVLSIGLQTESGKIKYWQRSASSITAAKNCFNEKCEIIRTISIPDSGLISLYILRENHQDKIPAIDFAKEKKCRVHHRKIIVQDKKEVIKPLVHEQKNDVNKATIQEGLVYKVQILTSGKLLSESDKLFKGYSGVSYYLDNGIYKYTVGEFATLDEAAVKQKEMRDAGFKGAFVVKFVNGERVK
ncbi:MAG: hypothetical protein K1X56_05225 [Flavobacteriales bacterium]|nr:hypothetical protein [Flavobacteriales bacterium]